MTDIDQCNSVRGEEMEKSEIRIRTAKVQDAEELLKIYAPYVKNTAITFEYEIPSMNESRESILGLGRGNGRLWQTGYEADGDRQYIVCRAGRDTAQDEYSESECLYCISGDGR